MDEKLHIVRHLYGEGEDRVDVSRLLEDEAIRKEYEALAATKALLDKRSRVRPAPDVIDKIMAAAADPAAIGQAPPLPPRMDRTARPGRAVRRYRMLGVISATLAVVLAVAVGLNQYRGVNRSVEMDAAYPVQSEPQAPARSEADALLEKAEAEPDLAAGGRQGDLRERRADQPAPAAMAEEAPGESTVVGFADRSPRDEISEAEEDSLPAWDDADELLRVHRRIGMLRARSLEGTWDESEVMSLDSMPQQPAPAQFDAASTKRSNDH